MSQESETNKDLSDQEAVGSGSGALLREEGVPGAEEDAGALGVDTHSRRKIIVTLNGPYLVIGSIPMSEQRIINAEDGLPLKWEVGQQYKVSVNYRLCRCGRSAERPFCDDTHFEIDFDGTETAGTVTFADLAKEYKGVELTLLDAEELCSGASFCDRLGGTWQLTISPDEKDRQEAISQVCNCPSGRLVMRDNLTGGAIEPVLEQSIGLTEGPGDDESGPIWVRGMIPVIAADGTKYELRMRVTLCRCGASKNKPFCDATHEKIHFSSKKSKST